MVSHAYKIYIVLPCFTLQYVQEMFRLLYHWFVLRLLVLLGLCLWRAMCVRVCVCVCVCMSQQNDGVKSARASPIKLKLSMQSYRVLAFIDHIRTD